MQTDHFVGPYTYSPYNLLGKGKQASVYLGIDTRTNQKVAIKQFSKEVLKKNSILKNTIKNEINALSLLNNDNVIRLLEVLDTKNNTYMILEYCEQGDLNQQLNTNGYFNEDKALNILIQLLQAISSIREKNIFHRDLKPANILFTNNKLKLADFGFSVVLKDIDEEFKYYAGTPLYMSPQLLREQKASFKADIWSIGIIYYECLYGRLPWTASQKFELQQKILYNSLKFPQYPIVSQQSKDFIIKCLKTEEFQRFNWEQLISHPLVSNKLPKTNQSISTILDEWSLKLKIIESFKKQGETLDGVIFKNQLDEVMDQYQFNRLLNLIGSRFSQEISNQIFQLINKNQSQFININQIRNWLNNESIRSRLSTAQQSTKSLISQIPKFPIFKDNYDIIKESSLTEINWSDEEIEEELSCYSPMPSISGPGAKIQDLIVNFSSISQNK